MVKNDPQIHQISYLSDNLKIHGLLIIPNHTNCPLIIFNKGYISLDKYQIDKQYMRWMKALSEGGFGVFKSDYRGHGDSEGQASDPFSTDYTKDVLNGIEALRTRAEIDFKKIFMVGHSMGGRITLQALMENHDIKAASLFAPSLKTINFSDLSKIEAKIQIHHGKLDDKLPWQDSVKLAETLKKAGKQMELYLYENGDHNFTGPEFDLAMQRTAEFFITLDHQP